MSKLTDLAAKINPASPAIKAFCQEAADQIDALTDTAQTTTALLADVTQKTAAEFAALEATDIVTKNDLATLAARITDLTARVAKMEAPVPPPPTPPPLLTLTMTIKDGQTLTAPVSWEVTPSGPVSKVDFLVDGSAKWTESLAPYVFSGDGYLFDPSTLPNGPHTLTAKATLPDGSVVSSGVQVTVNVVAPPPATNTDGRVGFCMYATSQADKYTLSPAPTQAQKDWMNAHWNRAIIYMDQIAAWKTGDWGYVDMLALYCNAADTVPPSHPEWVLKDASGKYLKFYSSVQFLADPGNPAYQDYKAAQIAGMPARGYSGVHCDDVNLDRVTNAAAVNPRTGAVYTLPDWQRDMANMMTKVRAATNPNFELVHNSLWWASGPDVDRCIKQADVFELERGFLDANYTPAKIVQVWAFVDKLHSWGVAANHLSEAAGTQQAHFNLGAALMCSNGRDFHYGAPGWQPDAWDVTFDKDYGASLGPRVQTGTNTWKRDFEKGTVTVDLAAKSAVLP